MPYLAAPLSEEDMMNPECLQPQPWTDAILKRKWGNTSVPLQIVGWVDEPWWTVNLTVQEGEYKNFVLEADHWATQNVSSHQPIGTLYDRKGIQISFASDSSCENVGPCIQRYIHKTDWPSASQFQEVKDVRNCGENGTIPLTGSMTHGYCASYHTYHMAGINADPHWCVHNKTLRLVEAARSILHGPGYTPPEGIYIVCGFNAYRWIPWGAAGSCTLARVQPATWTWQREDLPYQKIPRHTLHKRSPAKSRAKPLIHVPGEKKFGLALTIFGLQVQNAHNIEKLAELFDNITDYAFDALNTTSRITGQLVLVTNQHTVVLDYLTAAQGGMCHIVRPACCHYVDNRGLLRIKQDLEQATQLKERFKEANSEPDWSLRWPDWLSWLNPANWFKGVGGWFAGILSIVVQGILYAVLAFCIIKLLITCAPKIQWELRTNAPLGKYGASQTGEIVR